MVKKIKKPAGKLATYLVNISNPVPQICSELLDYTQSQIYGRRTLLSISKIKNQNKCEFDIKMTCWSCGGNGPNNFKNMIQIQYPQAQVIFRRDRKIRA